MTVTQDTIVINEGFEARTRTTSSGTKTRYTLSVKTEPLLFDLNEVNLGAGPADAIRKVISDGIKAISATASESTLLKRKYAAAAFTRGANWAKKRYSGGKTGTTPPGQSDRLFNDSGRLADGVFVRQNMKERGWTINVPANRLDPSTFSMDRFTAMVNRLRDLVPVLRNPFQDPAVVQALNESIDNVLVKKFEMATKRAAQLKMQLAKSIIRLSGL